MVANNIMAKSTTVANTIAATKSNNKWLEKYNIAAAVKQLTVNYSRQAIAKNRCKVANRHNK